MFLKECSHSYQAKAVVDDYFLGQPGDAQYLCGLIGGLIEVKVAEGLQDVARTISE